MKFLVCPPEVSDRMKKETDLWKQRELLFNLDYKIVAVSKDKNGNIIITQHFRPEHTFTENSLPEKVTWAEPLHISTIVTIDKKQTSYGIAVQKGNNNPWQVYWYNGDKEIIKQGDFGILYLPQLNQLPLLNKN